NARLEVSSHHKVNEAEAAAVVDFPGGEFLQIVIKPSVSVWDWSAATALVLPVENREGEAIGLSIHADETEEAGRPRGSLSWWAWLPPNAATTLVLPLVVPDPWSRAMHRGPPIEGQPSGAVMVQKVKGAMDLRRVATLRLVVPSPPMPRRLGISRIR